MQASIDALGYRPNMAARTLRRGFQARKSEQAREFSVAGLAFHFIVAIVRLNQDGEGGGEGIGTRQGLGSRSQRCGRERAVAQQLLTVGVPGHPLVLQVGLDQPLERFLGELP